MGGGEWPEVIVSRAKDEAGGHRTLSLLEGAAAGVGWKAMH